MVLDAVRVSVTFPNPPTLGERVIFPVGGIPVDEGIDAVYVTPFIKSLTEILIDPEFQIMKVS